MKETFIKKRIRLLKNEFFHKLPQPKVIFVSFGIVPLVILAIVGGGEMFKSYAEIFLAPLFMMIDFFYPIKEMHDLAKFIIIIVVASISTSFIFFTTLFFIKFVYMVIVDFVISKITKKDYSVSDRYDY